jgi:hypothetical protein
MVKATAIKNTLRPEVMEDITARDITGSTTARSIIISNTGDITITVHRWYISITTITTSEAMGIHHTTVFLSDSAHMTPGWLFHSVSPAIEIHPEHFNGVNFRTR